MVLAGLTTALLIVAVAQSAGAVAPPAGNGPIVFTSNRAGGNDIWAMDPDGGHPRRLTDSEAADEQAAVSPDGTHIAFASSRTGYSAIWLMDADGSHSHLLTVGNGAQTEPTWSPDGRLIAYTAQVPFPRTAARSCSPVTGAAMATASG
jgi:Tol biopolymer transport system component